MCHVSTMHVHESLIQLKTYVVLLSYAGFCRIFAAINTKTIPYLEAAVIRPLVGM